MAGIRHARCRVEGCLLVAPTARFVSLKMIILNISLCASDLLKVAGDSGESRQDEGKMLNIKKNEVEGLAGEVLRNATCRSTGKGR